MDNQLEVGSVWKNVTRKQFITIISVNVNEKMVTYIDNSDNGNNPKPHSKTINHILRLYEFSTTIKK